MKVYRYYCRFRPPMPGAIPKQGLVNLTSFDYRQSYDGIECWGWVEYDRELTKDEINDYELAKSSNDLPCVEYKGYEISYIPQDKLWAVVSLENPQLGVIAYCDTKEEIIEGIDGLMLP